jgi:signal transduction histidine kinase
MGEGIKCILDAVPYGISVHSAAGDVLFVNRKLLQIYDKRIDEMEGESCASLFHAEGASCPHEDVMAQGKSVCSDKSLTIGDRVYEVSVRPMVDDAAGLMGFVRVMRDVTGEVGLKEQVVRAEQLATLGQMVNGIAHDVGTPLNIISGYSEYLLMRTESDGQGRSELSTILQQTRRIAEYIRQMLDLARPAGGRADAIQLTSFIEEVLELIKHHLRKGDVKASVTYNAVPPILYGDAPRLRQAFFNVLMNGCNSVGRGGSMELVIEGSEDGQITMISLFGCSADNRGCDFSSAFSPLLAGPNMGEETGIGLFLAKEVFDRFGAVVQAPEAGELGSPLIVILPNKGGQSISR